MNAKLMAAMPLVVALLLAISLWAQPQGAITRGPSTGLESQDEELLRLMAQAKHDGDDTFLTLLEVGNLLMTGIGFLTVVFKGGKYVEKVDRSEVEIANLWKVVRREGHE